MKKQLEPSAGPGREGFLPCVWMSAGLVAYRLCDRDYDCERCPFDRAMRGGPGNRPAEGQHTGWDETTLEFPDDRRYHRAHGWAQRLDSRTIRIGIDALAARLLGRPSSLILPVSGSRVERGRTACWVADGPELLALRSPVSGGVRRRNEMLRADPGLLGRSPYDQGWLLDIELSDGEAAMHGLLGARRIETLSRTQFRELSERIATRPRRDGAEVGPTLQDGGVPLLDPRRILGRREYLRLIRRLLR